MSVALQVSVRQLKPELLGDFLHFFDKEAFSDFPDWSGCYCGFYETAGSSWDAGPDFGPTHRKEKTDRIEAGKTTGFLAFVYGKGVGWCNGPPRANFTNM